MSLARTRLPFACAALGALVLGVVLPCGATARAQAPVTTAPPPGSSAAPATHQVTVLGLGLTTCEGWSQMRGLDAGNLAEQWMLGFLSGGAAFGASNYLGGMNPTQVLKLALNYCSTNPHAPLAVVAVEVAKELEAPMGRAVVHP